MVSVSLPKHDVVGTGTRALEAGALALACALVGAYGVRAAAAGAFEWWLLPALVAGALAADVASGLVHWFADTWGSDSLPVLGRRLLRPFRVHHANPEDLLLRDFLDCNGDVALLACLPLLGAFFAPAPLAAFLFALGAVSLPTNQVHQWAHRPEPPRAVAWLQRRGAILSRESHARHHRAPYAANYCIATGWCNGALEALGFFRALERAVTLATGAEPRAHDCVTTEMVGDAT